MADLQPQIFAKKISKIRQNLEEGNPFKLTYQQLDVQQKKCAECLQNMSNFNNYTHFGQVASIQEKYRLMKDAVRKAKSQNLSQRQLANQIKKIVQYKQQVLTKNVGNGDQFKLDINSQDVYVPQNSQTLDAFFKKKESQLAKKQSSFKRILNSQELKMINQSVSNKSMSKNSRFSKSHLKRQDDKQIKLRSIIEQHKKAIAGMQNRIKQDQELNQFEKNLLRQQKNRYIEKMEQLQQQIQQLYRDNYRLRELQKTAKVQDSFNASQLKEKDSLANAYQPYVIKTRVNDLNKINAKNQSKQEAKLKQKEKVKQKMLEPEPLPDYLGDKLQKEKPFTAKQFFNKKGTNYGLYQEKFNKKNQSNNMILKDLLGDSFQRGKPPINRAPNMSNYSIGSIGNGNHFDTFQLAQTLPFINDSVLGESRNIVNMTRQVSTRNKVAFFKNSLVLIRNEDFQIAFKRSDFNQKMDLVRLIFYINNKTNRTKRVKFSYEYQAQYFDIKVQEKASQVPAKSQGREVLTIELISRLDLNGVTDIHVQVDESIYDLWLPINFIRFKQASNYRMPEDTVQMTVLPDRQFSSFAQMQKITPVMYGGHDSAQSWAYLYGQSKFGNFPIKLTWRQRDLIIETTDKWLDFIGFIFHFFK